MKTVKPVPSSPLLLSWPVKSLAELAEEVEANGIINTIAHYSRKIRRNVVAVFSVGILSQASCFIPDEEKNSTCEDPTPGCQAICGDSYVFPLPAGCLTSLPRQNQFLDILGKKTCKEWRVSLPTDKNTFIITPQMVGITAGIKDPCYR